MKSFFTPVIVIMITSMLSLGQTNEIKFSTIKKVADKTAISLWGDVSDGEVFPLYSKDNEIIAYRFNFSFNKPFPDKEALIEKCKTYYENGDKDSHWGIGEYGYIMVSARKDMDVIQSYSDVLSPEYAERFKMIKLAKQKLGNNISLKKVYYFNFENQWFCFTNGHQDIYVRIFPAQEVVNDQEFHKRVENMEFFCETGDFTDVWNQYLSGNVLAGKSQVWIPNHNGYCKFYDWCYGCSPTAAAMLVSWWDYNSINTSYNYSKIVDYYYERWDDIEGEWDYQVPNAQKELALAMNTDTTNGSTDRNNIAPGYQNFLNSTNGYNFTCTDFGNQTASWNFNKIQSEIGTYNRPLHISIPGHSECCVAYDVSANQIAVHNTWWGSVEWRTYTDVQRVYTFEQGGSNGFALNLSYPLGDTYYNHNGNGETLYAGDVVEVTWGYDYSYGSTAIIDYSINGGASWTNITYNAQNNGIYNWLIPSGINSDACRIRVYGYSSANYAGGDASIGNFFILPGGSVAVLNEESSQTTFEAPEFYKFINYDAYWYVVGIRDVNPGDDWDIYLFDDDNFSNIVASSTYGGNTVDFVVIDGNKTPVQYRGIKASRYSGSGQATIEFEGGSELLYFGNNYDSWPAYDVVEMYDVYLQPGYYGFSLDITSGTADLDFGIYGSSGSPYYAPRSSYLSFSSSSGGGGDEYFNVNITSAGYYGVCVWANDNNSAEYNINIESAGRWKGTVSSDWHDPANWSANKVPDATIDVTIPAGTAYSPDIWQDDAFCKSLTVETGQGLSVHDKAGTGQILELYVIYNMNISGGIYMWGGEEAGDGEIVVSGNINWYNGSHLYTTSDGQIIRLYGNWFMDYGAQINMDYGTVIFDGSDNSYIECYDPGCYLNNVTCWKSGSAHVIIPDYSTSDLTVKGDITIQTGNTFNNYNAHNLILEGNINNYGSLIFDNGTLVMAGNDQVLMLAPLSHLNNLTISSSGITYLNDTYYGNLFVMGNVEIESGSLLGGQDTIRVGGNWTDNVGPDGFYQASGRVVFFDSGHQYCYGEDFNILEMNKSGMDLIIPAGATVTCEQLDWTDFNGEIEVDGGTFRAYDLEENGIFGSYYLTVNGGLLELHQDIAQYVDLDGKIVIDNGTFDIYGGNGYSYWPYLADGELKMYGGVLDFKDVGIYVYDYLNFNEDITGGVIKTVQGFIGLRNDFQPSGGTFEFYGSDDFIIEQFNGCTLHNVEINKSSKESGSSIKDAPVIDKRSNKVISYNTKSNMISLGSDFSITNNLVVTSGIIEIDTNTLSVHNSVDVNDGGTLIMEGQSILKIGDNGIINVNNGGLFSSAGSISDNALVTHNTGYYKININSGGTLSSEYTTFEFIDENGLFFDAGSMLDPAHPINYCTVQNVLPSYISSDITILNSQTVTCTGFHFPDNPGYNVWKDCDAGNITFNNATGTFAGPDYEYDPYNRVQWPGFDFNVDLKVLLEGPFNGSNMNTTLKNEGLIPLSQPFGSNSQADWYYTGAESVSSIPASVVDWVLVDLRDATSAENATPATSFKQMAAFVLNTGQIVALDGSSILSFSHSFLHSLYVVVWHRNHLGVISANALNRTGNSYIYDFSSGPGQAYGNTSAQKLLGGGKWGMISGDGNGDGNITVDDINNVWKTEAGTKGYLGADYNMDTQVENSDKNDNTVENLSKGSQIPE